MVDLVARLAEVTRTRTVDLMSMELTAMWRRVIAPTTARTPTMAALVTAPTAARMLTTVVPVPTAERMPTTADLAAGLMAARTLITVAPVTVPTTARALTM